MGYTINEVTDRAIKVAQTPTTDSLE
jgi:hypothetical protein